jgi:hypothetical protein
MHYHAEVLIKDLVNIEDSIEKAMEPFKETWKEEEISGFWDWWQIGGRWTGIKSGYKPSEDPRNIEECPYCNGTGTRTDMVVENGCNACHGKGKKVKWPTEWVEYQGDVCHVNEVKEDLTCHTMILGEKALLEDEWNGETWVDGKLKGRKVKDILKEYGITEGYLVTVDYHC